MLDIMCVDGEGTYQKARVSDNALNVIPVGYPPFGKQKVEFWGQKLTDDGLTTGSDDMGVGGAAIAVPFWVPADADADIYITRLSIVVGYGAAAKMYDFADSGAPLTNGVLISYIDAFGESITIGNPKNNYSFLRFALSDGIIPTAWELRNLGALNDYGFLVSFDFQSVVPPYGIQLLHGTNAKLQVTIRDDCSDADTFNMRAFGFKRFK